jgi:Cof subfamily protein (haloacid dehalogenase superfamily)
MIKLFASDSDNTLLNIDHESDVFIDETIRQIVDAGLFFTIATGRSATRLMIPNMDDKIYHIYMNGAYITGPDGEVVYKSIMDKEILRELIESCPEYEFCFVGADKQYMMISREKFLAQSFKAPKGMETTPEWIKNYTEMRLKDTDFSLTEKEILDLDICKINLYVKNDMNLAKMDAFLEKHKDKIINAPTNETIYEITMQGVDKGAAVAVLAKYLNLSEDECAVYGDGGNDVTMLKRFKHSYSPADGSPDVICHASKLLEPYATYSVSKHMRNTLLEQKKRVGKRYG